VKEILKKVRKYEIKIRKFLNSRNQGDYKSIFKGTGLDFDDLRPYQYGDDFRTINWNITAKEDVLYTNTYKEEKEQSVFFLLDISKSQNIGDKKTKISVIKEIASVLTLSALNQKSQVGLICFSDIKEIFIDSKKGDAHGYKLIRELYKHKNKSEKTNIAGMIDFFMNVNKKKSLVILLSDFIDSNYHSKLRSLSKLHDVICIHIYDKIEINIPKLGIIELKNEENNYSKWINTSSQKFRESVIKTYTTEPDRLKKKLLKYGITYLNIDSEKNYIKDLIKLFKSRKK
tara:strand:- start:3296 stop:4156 length:861 start_codon:yes stop_codon:yes gene_type:complete